MPSDVSDERLSRALTAFLRQEVQAPATAITDFLDMIIEDARASQPEDVLADLARMRRASVQLNAFVRTLLQESAADRQDETADAFHRRLRHDLRTPLNAIKGYSELLIEDMDGGQHPAAADLEQAQRIRRPAARPDRRHGRAGAAARPQGRPMAAVARSGSISSPTCCARSQPLPAGGAARERCRRAASSSSTTTPPTATCWDAGSCARAITSRPPRTARLRWN